MRILGLIFLLVFGILSLSGASQERRVLMVGDSIVQQMVGHQRALPSTIRTARLAGVGGQTARQIADRVTALSFARLVVLEAGTNDLFGLNQDDGIVPAYRSMLDALKSAARVVVIGIPPVDESQLFASWGQPGLDVLNNARIASINAGLAGLCAGYSNCIVATSVMHMDMTERTTDGIHFTADGYQLLAEALQPYLSAQ